MTGVPPGPNAISTRAAARHASIHGALWRRPRSRRLVQAVRVARTLSPSARFVLDVLRDDPARRYVWRHSGLVIYLRPRLDLQDARELLSKRVYELPADVRAALEGSAGRLTVLDLGANIGLFALDSIRMLGQGTRVVAVEADPSNAELLRMNVSVNGYGGQVSVHAAAAGREAGTVRFAAGRGDSSRVVDRDDPYGSVEVPMVDAFTLASGCHLIKMDIEGSEWELLRDPRMGQLDAKALVVEWHADGFGTGDPAAAVVQLLRRAGFCTWEAASRSTAGMVWGWREDVR